MALIERIQSMKQEGVSEPQIINQLREEGISSLEINEALSQSKIKEEIAGEPNNEELQQSIMPEASNEQQMVGPSDSANQNYNTQAPQAYAPEQYPVQDYSQQQYSPEQYAYAQQQYPQEQQAYYQQAIDLETVRDIARQETDEALKKIKEQISSFEKIKTELSYEIQSMDNRLTKVESIINELQSAILKRMGEYGSAISGISQEVRATQNSFAKIINPLLDKKRGISSQENSENEESQQRQQPMQKSQQSKQAQQKQSQNKQSQRTSNPTATFEDYFR